nr:hypothetical protein [Tanacetum cinerariifolium]
MTLKHEVLYLCNLCGNNSHDGYDCQQQFLFVHEQELSYNQNYDETSDKVFQANHSIQNEESFENPSDEIAVSSSNPEEPPQDYDICQLIREECCVEASEEQKQKHPSITPEMESDEVTESNAENLLPIPSKCEVASEDEIECDMPANDDCSPIFTTFSNPLFNNDDLDFSDDKSLPEEDVPAEEFKIYSNPLFDEYEINSDKLDPHCFNVESDFVESLLNRDTFIDFSSKFDFSGELARVNPEILKFDFDFEEEICLIENLLYDNSFPRLPEELNTEIADIIVESIPSLPIPVQDGNSQREEINVVTKTDDVLPSSVENDDDSLNDPLLEEVDLFLSNNSIPPGIENVADDPEGDIHFLEELLIDDSVLSHESSDSNFEDNLSIPRPPLKPPDAETDA